VEIETLCFESNNTMEQTLIAQSGLPNACDIFVLSEGAHRYRDALALAVLMRNLGPARDVQVWPVLSPQEVGDRVRSDFASQQRSRLVDPTAIDRSAIVIGRVELFGPDIGLDLLSRLQPPRPVHMEDTPSAEPEYHQSESVGTRRKAFRITPKSPGAQMPLEDRAQVYSGWQFVQRGRRRIVILEGISALGTIGAVKAFCSPECFPAQLDGIESFFVSFDVKLRLHKRGRGRTERELISKSYRAAAAVLPWRWEDVLVKPQERAWQAVAPIERVGEGECVFLGASLMKPRLKGARNDLRNRVLAEIVARAGEWINDEDVVKSVRGQAIPGGRTLALGQVLESLVAHGVCIERADDRFRHIARV
jgi:hypothetical protein